MKLKVKNLNVGSGGPLVAIINYKDAEIFDLHNGDRIELKYGKKNTICILDISYVGGMVPAGRIGLFKELIKKLKVVNNKLVNLEIVRSPKSIKYIKKKMDGATLTKEEINEIISDVVDNKLSEFELAFFVAATYMRPMNNEETINLAKAMVDTGDVLKWGKRKIMDKHCIGGVAGNRTTMVVVPIIAAAGLTIPKTSSRSITSPAGTSDTMEVLCSVSFDKQQIRKIVKKINGCLVWGGAVNFAPADDKIIKVEHSFNIDARSQLLSSILAKKASVGATHVLIDIPTGKGSKIEDKKNAELLKNDFKNIGKKLGMKIQIVFTNGTEPIGMGIGPVLEARDVLLVLKNDHLGPLDLRKKSLKMAGIMLEMGGKAKKGNGEKMATKILHSGKAYEKFIQIIKAQGGKEVLPSDLKVGKFKKDIKAWKRGRVSKIGNREISRIARVAGAPKDIGAGIFLHKKTHTYVHKGETIFTIYAHSKEKLGFALETYKALGGIEIN